MMKFDNTIDYKIDKRARHKNRHVTIVYDKFANLQICCYIFRTHNIDINQHFNF